MPAINISKLKYTWKGQWTSGTRYIKNDVVQWNGSSYTCIQDLPDEFELAVDTSVNTVTYKISTPEIYFIDRRPDNVAYWKLIVRGNTFKRGWMPHRTYQLGDIVRYGGDLYMYSGVPGFGATATSTISNGQVTSITVSNGGTGYTTAPTVTIFPPNTSLFSGAGAQAYCKISNGVIISVVITSPGNGYNEAPIIVFNAPMVRNTCPEDTTYWTKVFENPNYDSRRMYAVATPNMQPLGWTRNYGDYPNPQTTEGQQLAFIDALGVPYTLGTDGTGGYNIAGRGIRNYCTTWQPSGFTFVDWLRSTNNQTNLGITVPAGIGLSSPDGKPPRCIQWVKSYYQSVWLFNNGEVYYSGINSTGDAGNSTAQGTAVQYPVRCTNQSTTGYLGETLPLTFNQTKIIKVDMPTVGSTSSSSNSVYALGSDGSMWAWGYNGYGQLGLGQLTPNAATTYNTNQIVPIRIPAHFFDYKKIVDFMCFGNEVTSVLAIDEDGDLWGWGADYYGELGLGAYGGRDNRRPIPTRIPFDFKKYGGIKKMSYYHYSTTGVRAAFILTNDGSLFGAGYFRNFAGPLDQNVNNSQTISKWTRFINTNVNVKAIENFWVVGDQAYNIYIREKDTGLTYAMGDNYSFTLGSQAPTNYWWNSGGLSGGWSLLKGPRNLVHVTNNCSNSATDTNGSYLTVVLLEENGRLWGQGLNSRGSLGLGFNGAGFETPMQNPETGGAYMFQPIKTPAGARFSTTMGCGTSAGTGTSHDLGMYITDDGQVLYCGNDSNNRTGTTQSQSGMIASVQGSTSGYWWRGNLNPADSSNPSPADRSMMHSQPGD